MLTPAGQPGTIVQITLMTSEQASVLMSGEAAGVPDAALVCYVKLRGPFVLNVSVPRGAELPQSQNVHFVFDAQMGKLLVFGTASDNGVEHLKNGERHCLSPFSLRCFSVDV